MTERNYETRVEGRGDRGVLRVRPGYTLTGRDGTVYQAGAVVPHDEPALVGNRRCVYFAGGESSTAGDPERVVTFEPVDPLSADESFGLLYGEDLRD